MLFVHTGPFLRVSSVTAAREPWEGVNPLKHHGAFNGLCVKYLLQPNHKSGPDAGINSKDPGVLWRRSNQTTSVDSSASNSIRGWKRENMSSHHREEQSICPTFASANAKILKKKWNQIVQYTNLCATTETAFPLGDKPAVVEKLHNLSQVKSKFSVRTWIHQSFYNCSPVMGLGRECRLRT